jgi:hypothetical protein
MAAIGRHVSAAVTATGQSDAATLASARQQEAERSAHGAAGANDNALQLTAKELLRETTQDRQLRNSCGGTHHLAWAWRSGPGMATGGCRLGPMTEPARLDLCHRAPSARNSKAQKPWAQADASSPSADARSYPSAAVQDAMAGRPQAFVTVTGPWRVADHRTTGLFSTPAWRNDGRLRTLPLQSRLTRNSPAEVAPEGLG